MFLFKKPLVDDFCAYTEGADLVSVDNAFKNAEKHLPPHVIKSFLSVFSWCGDNDFFLPLEKQKQKQKPRISVSLYRSFYQLQDWCLEEGEEEPVRLPFYVLHFKHKLLMHGTFHFSLVNKRLNELLFVHDDNRKVPLQSFVYPFILYKTIFVVYLHGPSTG